MLREGEALTLPVQGQQGEWIVKLDSSRFPQVVENEYATLEWARAAGFPVPECHVEPAAALAPALRGYAGAEGKVLVIRRYDRVEGRRIHQEDFAQVTGLPPRLKYDHITYEQLARIVVETVGPGAYDDFVQRLAFVVATGNTDAHLKNWSLVYPDGIKADLSPLYDQVCTIAWPELKPELALKLAGMKHLLQIEEKSFSKLAAKAGTDGERTVALLRRGLERIAEAWSESRGRETMPAPHVAALREYWERAPLLKRHAAGRDSVRTGLPSCQTPVVAHFGPLIKVDEPLIEVDEPLIEVDELLIELVESLVEVAEPSSRRRASHEPHEPR